MITKIQSFTDLITNSSSTVFVMYEQDANYYDNLEGTGNCIWIFRIDMNWLRDNIYEFEMVCDLLDIDPSEITTRSDSKWRNWQLPDQEAWNTFLDIHEEEIKDVFQDLYWVDIEDHFEDAYDVTNDAIGNAIWYESRH